MSEIFYQIFGAAWQIFNLLCLVLLCAANVYLLILLTKALRRYLHSPQQGDKESIIKKSLGEVIKEYRIGCSMTQEFVAENLGVSRQAVSKWESGKASPSTANLFALAKLFHVPAEELIRKVSTEDSRSGQTEPEEKPPEKSSGFPE